MEVGSTAQFGEKMFAERIERLAQMIEAGTLAEKKGGRHGLEAQGHVL
ncbi:MAG: hypothetical protein ACYDAB_17885 [bacterium]